MRYLNSRKPAMQSSRMVAPQPGCRFSLHPACLGALLLAAAWQASAQEVSLLIQRSTLAGFRYHEAPLLARSLRHGEPLQLIREPDNPHDSNAVRVEWQGRKLGYVPRARNAALAWAMDQGEFVAATVVREAEVQMTQVQKTAVRNTAEQRQRRHNARRLEFDVLLR